MAANFAGVIGANDARNDIVVRGNSPAAMLWQMEGMNIPNPNHFGSLGSTGGPVSMLNNNVLEKSDFMTSAFPAMYGNAIGGAFAIEPRLGVTAMVSPSLSLNAGYGLHSQRQGIYEYNVLTATPQGQAFTNKSLGFSRSHHGVVGLDWYISDAIRLKAEGYYQSLFDIPVTQAPSSYSAVNSGSSFAPDTRDSLVNEGTGTNIGVELTLEHFFRDGFYFLATASLFDSKYKGSDGIEHNTAGEAEYSNAEAYSLRQTPYFRLDLKLGYRVEFASSTLEFSLDLQNITNHQNVFLQRYNASTGQVSTEYQQGFFPVPLVRYTF